MIVKKLTVLLVVDECCTVGPDKDEEVEMDDDLLDEIRRELANRRRRP